MITFFKNLVGALRPLGIALYKLDASGNPTGFKDYSGSDVTPTAVAEGWTALQAIPKTAANDDLIMLVNPDKRLMTYDHSVGDWLGLENIFEKSIAWFGDSLTAQSGVSCHPLLANRVPYYMVGVPGAWTGAGRMNVVGNFVTAMRCDPGVSTTGSGTLTYNVARHTLSWAAPGDAVGAEVDVADGGWFKLNSATANLAMYITIYGPNHPVLDTAETLSLSGLTTAMGNNNQVGVPGYFNAAYGNPFGENQYWFCGEGFTAAQLLVPSVLAQWRDVYSDISYIDLGTNGISSKATADSVIADIQAIINHRKAVGSRVIVKSVNLSNVTATAAGDDTRMAKHYANAVLKKLADSMEFEFIDTNRFTVNRLAGTLRAPSFANDYNTDLQHLSGLGAYKGAVKALYPTLSRYIPEESAIPTGLISYDSAKCPTGNLLTNGLFKGTGGTKGGIVTGDLADSWSAARAAGATITAVGTMPQSASPIARTDGVPGYWAELAVDNTNVGHAAGEALRIVQTAYVSGSNYTTGDVLVLSGEAEVEYVSGNGVWGLVIFLAMTGGGRSYALNVGGNSTMNATLWDCNGEVLKYKFSSPPLAVLAGATNLDVYIDMYMHDNSKAKFRFSQDLRLRKLI